MSNTSYTEPNDSYRFTDEELSWASKVSMFMMQDCYKWAEEHLEDVTDEQDKALLMLEDVPFGDLAYGKALCDWNKRGRPRGAWFSTAPGNTPCAFLMAFRKMISDHFGLPILTTEEGEARRLLFAHINTVSVTDWCLN